MYKHNAHAYFTHIVIACLINSWLAYTSVKSSCQKNNDKICSCNTNWITHLSNVDNDNFGIYIWKRSQEFQTIIHKIKRKSKISVCACIPTVKKHALTSEAAVACALYVLKIGSCL